MWLWGSILAELSITLYGLQSIDFYVSEAGQVSISNILLLNYHYSLKMHKLAYNCKDGSKIASQKHIVANIV